MAINNPVIADADIIQDTAVAIQEKDHGGKMEISSIPSRIRALPTADPYEIMNDYITGTILRLRLNNVPSGGLQRIKPGSNLPKYAITTINRIELPNNTDNLISWQFAYLTNLKLFDVGYPKRFENVCIRGTKPLEKLIIRTEDTCPYLHSTYMPNTTQIYVNPSLITNYENETNWSFYAGNYHGIYYANSDTEKETLINDSSVPNESMIVCDYNESYYVKGEGAV